MDSILKFITCGSVDDGKSPLIGHMLYDAKLLYTDQVQALELDSKVGSNDGQIDYSLLLDGLMAEREQGITIDVAYRYFTTDHRSFIVADCPGHEQYTRNMAVGASFADLAVILVDASKGVVTQTRRHTLICTLMGIRYLVLAVNKMDLVRFDMQIYDQIRRDFKVLCANCEIDTVQVIPLSATDGDNVTEKSKRTPWYKGPSLLQYLETTDIQAGEQGSGDFLMPVQRVCRPHRDFRGFQGEVDAGQISVGEELIALPNRNTARVKQLLWGDKPVDQAQKGMPVTVQLDQEIDVSRGSVLTKNTRLELANLLNANLLWMDDTPMQSGAGYLLKCGTKSIPASIMTIKHKIDINTGKQVKAGHFFKNDIVDCDISLTESIVFSAFTANKTMGSFILIDRITNMTSACGTINFALRRAHNLHWQHNDITRELRAQQKRQKPLTLWFTGLSGAGKSTLANEIEKRLYAMGRHTMLLDGDNVRQGLNKNLGFKERDRVENIRRIAEAAKLMNDAGVIVLTAFISPFVRDRRNAREIIGDNSFIEIYVSTPLEVCEAKDIKGLYKKARAGEIPEFTGVTSAYEPPEHPQITIDTTDLRIQEAADQVMGELEQYLNL